MKLSSIIKSNNLEGLFVEGNFGIEKEGLRTDMNQKLAMTDHPDTVGDRTYHPYIHTDFSEAQPELVTPVRSSLKESFDWLNALHDVLHRSMSKDEYFWPYSMPNILPEKEEDIPIVRYNDPDAISYRQELADRYGKKKQAISGIHFNFSFSQSFIDALYEAQDVFSTKIEFQNDLYIKLAGNFLKHEWLLLYLFGASPYTEPEFFDSKSARDLDKPTDYVRSLRNSSFGYHNHDEVVVRYDTVEKYVEDIEHYVETDHLSEEREFYGNARLRGKGAALRDMLESGVQYIEFRSIDINPLARLGMTFDQAAFYHLFYMLMVWMDSEATTEEILEGQKRNLTTSDEHPLAESTFKDEALALLNEMKEMVEAIQPGEAYEGLVERAIDRVEKPEKTLSATVMNLIEAEGYLDSGRKLGLEYKNYSLDRPYVLNGFDDMELSTQLLMFDALQLGIETEILDRKDHFLKLEHQGHVEYVRNGNMTSKDTTISHFMMENKTVTKKVLAAHGYEVPAGDEFHSTEEALRKYSRYQDQAIVVKPKSTNMGVGISVFKEAPKRESYKEALEIAFKEDSTVLVEDFIPGTEYRFFVMDDKVQAVLLRVPANVMGDGSSTISELIDEKNKDPLRGEEHRTPLAFIEKGQLEQLMLKERGYDFDSVPAEGERVYLRENSNISTGGDSIDFTDDMHESYNEIAVGIAQALEVNVTGIDLIIPDYQTASTKEKPGYSCIEANFNPAMNMHAYVTEGKGRRLTKGVLALLFPEVTEKMPHY
jgi:glutamate--cysteine ligase/energy-coupling factor transport system ATP-binding protein